MKIDLSLLDWNPADSISDADWESWQRNCRAVSWLAKARKAGVKPTAPPSFVVAAIEDTIEKMKVQVLWPWGVQLVPVRRDGKPLRYANTAGLSGFDDLQVFWQRIFASVLVPELIQMPGFCSRCGKAIENTKKKGEPSQSKLCKKCSVYKWRDANREKYLKGGREYVTAKRKPKKSK